MLYPIYTSITSAPDDLSQFSVSVPVPVPAFRDFQLPYLNIDPLVQFLNSVVANPWSVDLQAYS